MLNKKYYKCLFLVLLMMTIKLSWSQKDSTKINSPIDRFSILAGGFLTGLSSDLIVGNEQLGIGLGLNVEDALGLETSTLVLRAEGEYNFGKTRKHQLSLSYFQLLRRSNKTLGRDIEVGDKVFNVGTTISSKFYLKIYKLKYDYAFFQDERMRLGASFGVFVMPISFSIEASRQEKEFFSFIAPLPVLGISTDFAITPKWTLSQSVDLLYIKIDNFQGVITDINLRLEYKVLNHFALGAGLNGFKLNLEMYEESDIDLDFVGSIKTSYTGLMFYAKYAFN